MMKLSDRLEQRQNIATLGSVVTAGITVTSSILVTLAVTTAGVGALVGLGVFAAGLALKSYDKKKSMEMKMELFDNFFDVDSLCRRAESDWKRRNPKDVLTDDIKKDIKIHLRRRLASHMGYSSPAHAAKPIAVLYAQEMLERAHDSNNPDREMYVEYIKGLGLDYEYDPKDEANSVPKASDIARKMIR
jgi:hypothetical protein